MNLSANISQLVEHLAANALYTEGPYRLSSGVESDWYLDGRQTTFDGAGARIVGSCVLCRIYLCFSALFNRLIRRNKRMPKVI